MPKIPGEQVERLDRVKQVAMRKAAPPAARSARYPTNQPDNHAREGNSTLTVDDNEREQPKMTDQLANLDAGTFHPRR